jgi:hypothetical protein
MLRRSFNRLVEKYGLLTIIALMFTLSFVKIHHLDVDAFSAEECEVGVKPGDWAEYEIDWISPPPSPYPVWVRREILDVNSSVITVNITQQMSDGAFTDGTESGDVANGTGASTMVFIPANLNPGDLVHMQGFDDVIITGETSKVYLGVERRVLYANFSSMGFDILIFWDKEKGVALEVYSIRTDGPQGITKVIKANLWKPKSFDGNPLDFRILILAIIIISLGAFIVLKRYVGSKRKKRRRKKKPFA